MFYLDLSPRHRGAKVGGPAFGRPPIRIAHAYPLAKQLRDARIAKGWAAHTMSKVLGYDQGTLGRWERGEIVPSILSFEVWANALGFDVQLKLKD
jgi:ribosome-binding protein aMBF1 (putative translation factor)